jgi:hypothetical protein
MALDKRRTLACLLWLIGLVALPAAAQSTREEWLALRARKEARENRLPVSYSRHLTVLTPAPFHSFTDSSGRLVIVGEVRNDSQFHVPLAYARITFRFMAPGGPEIAREWTYVHGGVNARIPGNNANETLLMPGEFGFFKLWAPVLPAGTTCCFRISEAVFLDYAPPTNVGIDFEPPRAALNADREWKQHPERWVPRVFMPNPPAITGQQVTGEVWNDDPRAFQGPSDLDNIFTYGVQVSVAVYQNGVISDVQSVTAAAPTPADACRGEPVTGMGFRQSAPFTIQLANPATSIARYSIEWQETNVSPNPIDFLGDGGIATFAIARECGWRATSSVPWITILDGAASGATGGQVTVYVEPNPAATARAGSIAVSGEAYRVVQGVSCQLVFNPTVFLGPGRHVRRRVTGVPTVCVWGVRKNVPWLTAIPDADALWLDAEPNFTAATRSGVLTIGNASFTVIQSAVSRRTDFNSDGHADLLWRHADGRIATWLMNGTRLIGGLLFSPSRWDGQPMLPVDAADLDANGTTDILWQNTEDGTPTLWHMSGTTRAAIGSIDSDEPATPSQKIRAVTDFNGDGAPDFLWQDDETGSVFAWYLSPPWRSLAPAASAPWRTVPDLNWKLAGSGDFNADGVSDLLWQHQVDGRIWVWKLNKTGGLIEASPITPEIVADLDWKIRAVADLNGDDKADIVWQHRVDGRVAVWLMDGTQLASGIVIAQLADTNWELVGPR